MQKKESKTVKDKTFGAEVLGNLFKNKGRVSVEAIKRTSYNSNEKSWLASEIASIFGTASVSKNTKAAFRTIPKFKNLYHGGKSCTFWEICLDF